MKNRFFLFVFLMVSLSAFAEAVKPGSTKFDVVGVGVTEIIYEELGEPIGAPSRVSVKVNCSKGGTIKNVVMYRGCNLESYELDRESKILTLKIIAARVVHNSGDVVCDQVDEKQVNLKTVCK